MARNRSGRDGGLAMRNDWKADGKLKALSYSRPWRSCILEVTPERIMACLLLAFVTWLRHLLSHRILRGRVAVGICNEGYMLRLCWS
jgi:hypothetical protein